MLVCACKKEEAEIPSHCGLLPCESAMCSVKILPSGPMSSCRARGMNVARQLRTPPTRHDLLPSFLIVSLQEQQQRLSLIQREMYVWTCVRSHATPKKKPGDLSLPVSLPSLCLCKNHTCAFQPMVSAEHTLSPWHLAFWWPVFYFVFNKASLKYPPPAALGKLGQLTVSEDDKLTCCLAEK